MSALGETTAVISIGCSCQTAMQVDSQLELLSSIVGENLSRASLPYDWLIMPPSALVSWISAGHGFPESPDEIVAHPNFNWPRHGLHFWHEFVRDGEVRVAELFADTLAKFDYLFGRFASLARLQRRIWIYSNTQNNLDVVRSVAPRLDFRLDALTINSVTAAVTSLFDYGTDEFLFICRKDRVDPSASAVRWPVRILQADDSETVGDAAQWATAFRDLIHRRPEAAADLFSSVEGISTHSAEKKAGPVTQAEASIASGANYQRALDPSQVGQYATDGASGQRTAESDPRGSESLFHEPVVDLTKAPADPLNGFALVSGDCAVDLFRGQRA